MPLTFHPKGVDREKGFGGRKEGKIDGSEVVISG